MDARKWLIAQYIGYLIVGFASIYLRTTIENGRVSMGIIDKIKSDHRTDVLIVEVGDRLIKSAIILSLSMICFIMIAMIPATRDPLVRLGGFRVYIGNQLAMPIWEFLSRNRARSLKGDTRRQENLEASTLSLFTAMASITLLANFATFCELRDRRAGLA